MKDFPLSREDWYSFRDDRTKRINGVKGFEDFKVGVIVGSKIESFSIQLMTVVALNIIARWCRNIRIEIPTDTISCLSVHKGRNLSDALTLMISEADPHGKFSFGHFEESECDEIIAIGNVESNFQKPHVWINGSGWLAGIGYGKPVLTFEGNDDNIVGPAFASCLGVAEIFKRAIGLPPADHFLRCFSLYDFTHADSIDGLGNPRDSNRFNFGRIHQVGCGAVGSSLDFLLSLTSWKADIDLIDYDRVSASNCNRSLIFSAFDAVNNRHKVHACHDLLGLGNFSSVPFIGSYDDFIRAGKFLDPPPDVILCLANDQDVWYCIQNNLPPIVLHATTTPNWGLNFGRHIPKKEWCIMCRFGNEVNTGFAPQCSEGNIGNEPQTNTPIQGVLPFLSPAAAVLILAEMAKLNLNRHPMNKNFIQFSTKSPLVGFRQQQRIANHDCMCKEQPLDYYPREMRNTKFWKLGQTNVQAPDVQAVE